VIGKLGTRVSFAGKLRHDGLLGGIRDTVQETEIDGPVNPHVNVRPDFAVRIDTLGHQSLIKIAVLDGGSVLAVFKNVKGAANIFQS
jgi:hypothetical protein